MPKRPIISRDVYFFKVPGSGMGPANPMQNQYLAEVQANVVNVLDVGICVETGMGVLPLDGKMIQMDVTDNSINSHQTVEDLATFTNTFGTGVDSSLDFNV